MRVFAFLTVAFCNRIPSLIEGVAHPTLSRCIQSLRHHPFTSATFRLALTTNQSAARMPRKCRAIAANVPHPCRIGAASVPRGCRVRGRRVDISSADFCSESLLQISFLRALNPPLTPHGKKPLGTHLRSTAL